MVFRISLGYVIDLFCSDEDLHTFFCVQLKESRVKYIEGTVWVQTRNLNNSSIKLLAREPDISRREGIADTYRWIEEQVKTPRDKG